MRLDGRIRLREFWEEEGGGWSLRSLEQDAEEAGDECAVLREGTAMWQPVDKKYGLIYV